MKLSFVTGLVALCLSAPLLGAAHAQTPASAKMSTTTKTMVKTSSKPMRDPKTGRFLSKSVMHHAKKMPKRDAKGRFIKKATTTRTLPMRDAKGHFMKSTTTTTTHTTHKM